MAQTVFRFYPEFVYTRIFLADEGGESSQSADEVTLSNVMAAVPAAGSSGGISDAERRAASGMLMEPLRQLTIEIKMKVSEVHAFRGRIRQQ